MTNKFHIYAVIIGIVFTLISFSYLLYNTELIPAYRDLTGFPTANLSVQQTSKTWFEYGSVFDIQAISRFWYGFFGIGITSAALRARIIFFVSFFLTFFSSYFSFFIVSKEFFKASEKYSFLVGLVTGVVFTYNVCLISTLIPPTLYLFSYLTLPVLMLCLVMYFHKKELYFAVISAILLTVLFTATPRYIIHFAVVFFSFSFAFIFFSDNQKETIFGLIKFCMVLLPLLFLLNLYWFLPLFMSFRTTGSFSLSPPYINAYEITAIMSNNNLIEIIKLTSSFWPTIQLLPLFQPSIFNSLLYILPLTAVIAITFWDNYDTKKRIFIFSGSIMMLIGFFLYVGIQNINPFFSEVYKFLNLILPDSINWMFRSPGYFATILLFVYLVNVTVLLVYLLNHEDNSIKNFGLVLVAMVVASTVVLGWQAFTGDFYGTLKEGYYFNDTEFYKNINFSRALPLETKDIDRTGKPYLNARKDIDFYIESKLESEDKQTVDYLLKSVGTDALLVSNSNISDTFKKFYNKKSDTYVYLLPIDMHRVYIAKNVIGVTSVNLDIYEKLRYIGDYTVFLDYRNIGNGGIILDPSIKDIILFNSSNNKIIKLFSQSKHANPDLYWSKASTADIMHGPWHLYLKKLNITNWQTDNGYGLLYTTAEGVKQNITFGLDKPGDYRLFLRYFGSKAGEKIKVYIDSSVVDVNTFDSSNLFKWQDLGVYSFKKGKQHISIENIGGFNAINVLVLVPENKYFDMIKSAEQYLSNRHIIYSIITDGSKATYSKTIDVYNEGNYLPVVFGDKSTRLSIDNIDISGRMYLSKGRHNISVTNNSLNSMVLICPEEVGVFDSSLPAEIINYSINDSTKWTINIKSAGPFVLAFTESYDKLWEARVYRDGKFVSTARHFYINDIINGFYIDETGNLTLIIRHKAQDYLNAGLAISGITFIISFIYITFRLKGCYGNKD